MSKKGLIGSWKFQEQRVNVGAELVTNGDMELDASWSGTGSPTTNERSAVQAHSGTYSRHLVCDAAFEGITQVVGANTGTMRYIVWIYPTTGTLYRINYGDSGNFDYTLTLNEWNKLDTLIDVTSGASMYIQCRDSAAEFYVDDVSIKPALISDLTPQGNELSLFGPTFTTDRKGLADSALSFDGVDDYCSGDSAITAMGTGEWTLGFWWTSNGAQPNYSGIIGQGFTGGTPDIGSWLMKIYSNSAILEFTYCRPAITNIQISRDVNDDSPHYISVTRGFTAIEVFVDGVSVGTGTLADSDFDFGVSGNTSYVGYNERDASYLKGNLDDIKMWGRKLSDAEILSEYNTYQPDGALNTGSLQKGLVAHFPLRSEYNKVGGALLEDDCVDDDTADWTVTDATLTFDTDHYVFERVADTQHIRQDFGTPEAGRTYREGAEIKNGVASSEPVNLRLSNGLGTVTTGTPDPAGTTNSNWQNVISDIIATDSTEDDFLISSIMTNVGDNILLRNLSIKPLLSADITPQGNHAEVWGADVQAEYTDFDGVASYEVLSSKINQLLSNSNDYGFSVWFKADETTSTQNILSSALGTTDRMAITISSNVIYLGHYTGLYNTKNIAFSDTASWHHLVMFKIDGVVYGYIDSVEMSLTTGQPTTAGTVAAKLGSRNDSGSWFNGQLDNARFYENTALIADRDAFVLALYNKGRN